MSLRAMTMIKLLAVCGLLAVAVGFGISRMHSFSATGEDGLQVWFYDQSEKELYTVPRETIAPHKGIGGEEGDGVKAVVVADREACDDSTKRRIAYLETYTQEYRELAEGIRSARLAGLAYDQSIPGDDSDFYEKNTLVRLVDDPTWYDMTTARGKEIVRQWRNERGASGRAPDVCTP